MTSPRQSVLTEGSSTVQAKVHIFKVCNFEGFCIVDENSRNYIEAAKDREKDVGRKNVLNDRADRRQDFDSVKPVDAPRNALVQCHHCPW